MSSNCLNGECLGLFKSLVVEKLIINNESFVHSKTLQIYVNARPLENMRIYGIMDWLPINIFVRSQSSITKVSILVLEVEFVRLD